MKISTKPDTYKGKGFFLKLGLGIFVTALLLLLKYGLEHTVPYVRIEYAAFEWLQRRMSTFDATNRLPVVVIDISKVPGGAVGDPTPREVLRALILEIERAEPTAIGIDIDFSPTETGWVANDDTEFLDWCLERASERPIYLGVQRAGYATPDVWLGLPKYKGLAASISWFPEDATKIVTRGGSAIERMGQVGSLPTLAFALASAHFKSNPRPSSGGVFSLIVQPLPALSGETSSDLGKANKAATEGPVGYKPSNRDVILSENHRNFLVNYSKIDQIRHEKIPATMASTINEYRREIAGRMVLVGNAERRPVVDVFNRPGEGLVPGVLFHASAAYSLAVEPVYELKRGAALSIDFIISIAMLLFVHGVGRGREELLLNNSDMKEEKKKKIVHRDETIAIWLSIAVVVLLGAALVSWVSLLWLDFVFVSIAIVLHRPIHDWLEDFVSRT